MERILQANTSGAWKNVLEIHDGCLVLESVRKAVARLTVCMDKDAGFRVIARRPGGEDKVIASWDSRTGWRGAWNLERKHDPH